MNLLGKVENLLARIVGGAEHGLQDAERAIVQDIHHLMSAAASAIEDLKAIRPSDFLTGALNDIQSAVTRVEAHFVGAGAAGPSSEDDSLPPPAVTAEQLTAIAATAASTDIYAGATETTATPPAAEEPRNVSTAPELGAAYGPIGAPLKYDAAAVDAYASGNFQAPEPQPAAAEAPASTAAPEAPTPTVPPAPEPAPQVAPVDPLS